VIRRILDWLQRAKVLETPEADTSKLCKDCKWFMPCDWEFGPLCTRRNTLQYEYRESLGLNKPYIDPVTGKIHPPAGPMGAYCSSDACSMQRSPIWYRRTNDCWQPVPCGPAASYFEKKTA